MTSDDEPQTIGARLKEWRDGLEINQAEAAEKVPVKQSTWCEWEGDNAIPSGDKAFDLERATDGAVTARMCAVAAAAKRAARARVSTGTDDE